MPTSRQNSAFFFIVTLFKQKSTGDFLPAPERKVTLITCVEGEARENTTCAVSYLVLNRCRNGARSLSSKKIIGQSAIRSCTALALILTKKRQGASIASSSTIILAFLSFGFSNYAFCGSLLLCLQFAKGKVTNIFAISLLVRLYFLFIIIAEQQ